MTLRELAKGYDGDVLIKAYENEKSKIPTAIMQSSVTDTLAWSVGSYVVDAMAIFLDKNSPAYPSQPRSMNSTESAPPGAKMTDADRFAAFAAEHNKRLRQRREK